MQEDTIYINLKITDIFSNHSILKDYRLKKLNISYPPCEFENERIDVVDWQEFVKNESERIPLLIANRAHLWPKKIPFEIFFQQERTVALLHIVYLNSVVLGCEVYRLPASFNFHSDFPKDYEKFKLEKL